MIVTVFDLDDTLYPELDYARSGLNAVGVSIEERYPSFPARKTMLSLLESGHRHNIFNLLEEILGAKLDIPSLVEQYRSHLPRISLRAGALDALSEARTRGKVGLISDGYSLAQHLKIQALRLEGCFDFVVLTGELAAGSAKPSRVPFDMVEDYFAGSQYCYVADNPEKDFIAPNRMGWFTVRAEVKNPMYHRRCVEDAHCAINELCELWTHWP